MTGHADTAYIPLTHVIMKLRVCAVSRRLSGQSAWMPNYAASSWMAL